MSDDPDIDVDAVQRTRKKNFTKEDIVFLVAEVTRYKDYLLSLKIVTQPKEKKDKIWAHITECLNARGPCKTRSVSEVKKKWCDLSHMAKKRARTKQPSKVSVLDTQIWDLLRLKTEFDRTQVGLSDDEPCLQLLDEEDEELNARLKEQGGDLTELIGCIDEKQRTDGIDERTGDGSCSETVKVESRAMEKQPRNNGSTSNAGRKRRTTPSKYKNAENGRKRRETSRRRAKLSAVADVENGDDSDTEIDEHHKDIPADKGARSSEDSRAVNNELTSNAELLSLQTERLGVEKRRLGVEEERLSIEKKRLKLEIYRWELEKSRVHRRAGDGACKHNADTVAEHPSDEGVGSVDGGECIPRDQSVPRQSVPRQSVDVASVNAEECDSYQLVGVAGVKNETGDSTSGDNHAIQLSDPVSLATPLV